MRAVLLAAGLFLIWHTASALLLVFAAALLAVVLHALARRVANLTRIPYQPSLALVIILIVVAIPTGFALIGVQVQDDFAYLANELPKALNEQMDRLGIDLQSIDVPNMLLGQNGWAGLLGGLANYTSAALSIVTSTALVVFIGIFLAVQPESYRRIIIRLFPKHWSKTTVSVLDNIGDALEQWMLGQLLLMVFIGVVTTVGLMIIGVPSALGLGVLAGLLEIVPFAGPIVAAVPAVLIALTTGYDVAAWTLLLYVGVQQIESNVIIPIVQRRIVSLAPALGLLSVMAFGIWLGPLGVMLSAPLAVCAQVLVTQLYSRDILGWDVDIPGTKDSRS